MSFEKKYLDSFCNYKLHACDKPVAGMFLFYIFLIYSMRGATVFSSLAS